MAFCVVIRPLSDLWCEHTGVVLDVSLGDGCAAHYRLPFVGLGALDLLPQVLVCARVEKLLIAWYTTKNLLSPCLFPLGGERLDGGRALESKKVTIWSEKQEEGRTW